MKLKPVGVIALGCLVAACDTAQTPPQSAGTGEAVTLQLISEQRSSSCKVNLRATYPRDVAPHDRDFAIEGRSSSLSRSEGPLSLPRPPEDPRPVENADGSISFDFYNWDIGGTCSDLVYELEIGACQSGACPPMVFQPDRRPGTPRVTLL